LDKILFKTVFSIYINLLLNPLKESVVPK